jgi:hypothetical protein
MISKHAGSTIRTVLVTPHASFGGADMSTMTTPDCVRAAYGDQQDRRSRPAYMRGIPGCVWRLALGRRPRSTSVSEA